MTPAKRNARKRLNPRPPLGGRSVPNWNSTTDRVLQSLSRVRTLCRALRADALWASIFNLFQMFGPLFSFTKTVKNSNPPKSPQNLKYYLGMFLAPNLVALGTHLSTNFLNI